MAGHGKAGGRGRRRQNPWTFTEIGNTTPKVVSRRILPTAYLHARQVTRGKRGDPISCQRASRQKTERSRGRSAPNANEVSIDDYSKNRVIQQGRETASPTDTLLTYDLVLVFIENDLAGGHESVDLGC